VPITTKIVSSNPVHGEMYSIQHYVIKFVSDLRQVGGFLQVLTNKTDCHDLTEILLKVALNTVSLFCNILFIGLWPEILEVQTLKEWLLPMYYIMFRKHLKTLVSRYSNTYVYLK
jgi:hypothetical protein